MTPPLTPDAPATFDVRPWEGPALAGALPRLEAYLVEGGRVPLSRHPGWLAVLERALGHRAYCFEAVEGSATRGFLPVAHVRSPLFGRFLVSLPYLNYGGPVAREAGVAAALVGRAVELADRLGVRYLELRQEEPVEHPSLVQRPGVKVHMRLELPGTNEGLWAQIPSKVRNQVRKAQKGGLSVAWGGEELLPEFYAVFSRNMRDLGTPVYGRLLFREVLRQFPGRAELCVVREGTRPLASALLLQGWGVAEVPSASSLREFNHTNANMLLYWHLLERSVGRGQAEFDFGRSSPESSTFRFKKQWGASPAPATWQYYVREGEIGEMRPDNPRYQRFIRVWKRLPVGLTRLIGPPIVRGIP